MIKQVFHYSFECQALSEKSLIHLNFPTRFLTIGFIYFKGDLTFAFFAFFGHFCEGLCLWKI